MLALARWLLYADLGVVFGVPAAAWLTAARFALPRLRGWLVAAALAGLALSVWGYLLLVAQMAGTGLADLDWEIARSLITQSALGWAFLARLAALVAVTGLWVAGSDRLGSAVAAGGIAVASLAWSGHAAAGEGALSAVQLGGDMLHLLAASAWIGALVLFVAMLFAPVARPVDPARAVAALARFSRIGSALVAILIATGLANTLFLASPRQWPIMASTLYGRLLIAKLLLFAMMLGLAALNRFRFVPSFALARLRTSVAIELALGFAVLLCVGLLGTLDPLAM
ncbi:copper resistance d domain protein [Novosphingobium sp. Rr 2-17]|uniref:copper homeostasis membrane protein CopD n=1 Tax=Novosphingobium sp. Rr 2-17 TaxID=555793 RepID=UPI000269955F|nr:copper homeostasis membrane protein CopD [Novosphingobium sp. Rr 2-17]EIZ78050.1 copper resistance d domain protein [Novosphingobium sp. Rr 2-17]